MAHGSHFVAQVYVERFRRPPLQIHSHVLLLSGTAAKTPFLSSGLSSLDVFVWVSVAVSCSGIGVGVVGVGVIGLVLAFRFVSRSTPIQCQ